MSRTKLRLADLISSVHSRLAEAGVLLTLVAGSIVEAGLFVCSPTPTFHPVLLEFSIVWVPACWQAGAQAGEKGSFFWLEFQHYRTAGCF